MIPFTLSAQCFHTLNTFKCQQNLALSFGGKIFQYSFEQLAFLSPLIFSHYMISSKPFYIEIEEKQLRKFLNCFVQLDSLLRQSSSLKINSQNVKVFSKIAESLDNSFLIECCESFFGKEGIEFSLNSLHLSRLSLPAKKVLKNFTLIINNKPILINYSLFCCVSDLLLHIDPLYQSFSLNVSNNIFQCFLSFMKVFDGIPFYWKKFQLSTILSMSEVFHLHSLHAFINDFVPFSPKNIEESIQFLSQSCSSSFENIFQQSVLILVENFKKLSFDQINSLSIEALQEILQNDQIQKLNQDYLLNLVLQLIEKDSNKNILLKNIKLNLISSKMMKEFLNKIHVYDLDIDLFEQIKF
jgi:hypothetical protein